MDLKRERNKFSHVRVPIECAQCGEKLYLPEWSECLTEGRVRHLWRCEICDYSFETTIRVTENVTTAEGDNTPADGVEPECA